jgi:hypothetical protein
MARARVIDALEARVKQFRSREELAMFRTPHEPLLLDALVGEALADGGYLDADDLRARTLIRFEWVDGGTWDAWAIALPSGLTLFCDSDGEETRVLASVKRGSQEEADRFFLELLAESRGEYFGIAMAGRAPDRSFRSSIASSSDIFVELFEGTAAELNPSVCGARLGPARPDATRGRCRATADHVLITPTRSRAEENI